MGGFSNLIGGALGGGLTDTLDGLAQAQASNVLTYQAMREFANYMSGQVQAPRPESVDAEVPEPEDTALINNFMIGCDPEFVGVGPKGELVSMRSYLPHEGPVGYDHGGAVGELRPRPGKGAWSLIVRLKKLVEQTKTLPGKLRAGAYVPLEGGERRYVTLGGHVHLGIDPYDRVLGRGDVYSVGQIVPYLEYRESPGYRQRYLADWVSEDLGRGLPIEQRRVRIMAVDGAFAPSYSKEHLPRVQALDALTSQLEGLDILPLKESKQRRETSDYGKYGDVRIKTGRTGVHHTEYRTMASWLHDPVVAFLCLTGAKVAAAQPEEAITLKTTDSWKTLTKWLEKFSKDQDIKRLLETYIPKGHKAFIIDPDQDFRERWTTTKAGWKEEAA